jgi:DNA transposition AAA+ family ATPase
MNTSEQTKNWKLVTTDNFNTVQNVCNSARQRTTLLGIIGFAGAGKTTALQVYSQNNENTYLVTCARTMKSKQFLTSILASLDISFLASDYEMVQRIVIELNNKKGSLLIIDESSKLSPNALMYIQDIFDGIEGNSGIVIAGVEYLHDNIKKSAEKSKVGMPEFFSRVAKWKKLSLPTRTEIKTICEVNGITDKEIIKDITKFTNYREVRNRIINIKTA